MAEIACPRPEQLQTLVQGHLPGDQAEALRRHLGECPSCARAARVLQVGDEVTLPPAPAPSERFDFLAPPQASDEIGRLGPYRVLRVLGQGGMGVVFAGEDVKLGRAVALKAMLPEMARRPEARDRFLVEARAAAAVEHDHIVPIYQVDEDRGVPYIAMPLLKGASLDNWLRKKGHCRGALALRVGQILKLGRETARGLAAAHERGLVHRDIKPANLWLDANAGGRVKILDFGLARLTGSDRNLTQTGMILGTPAYMAPEQARGEKVDGRADLFSLGVVLYLLGTGQSPFKGVDVVSTLLAVAMDQPIPPVQLNPELPDALSTLVMQMLEKDRDRRPASAAEVATRLQKLQRETGVSRDDRASIVLEATPDEEQTTVFRESRPARRRQLVGWLLATCAAAALVTGLWIVPGLLGSRTATLRVEMDDPNVELVVRQGDAAGGARTQEREFTLNPAQGKSGVVEVYHKGGPRLLSRAFELRRGGTSPVRVSADDLAQARKDAARPIDLLVRVDLARDQRAGEWKRIEERQLLGRGLKQGEDYFLVLPYEPPSAYRLRLVVRRVREAHLWVGLASGEGRAMLWTSNSQVGLSIIDGVEIRVRNAHKTTKPGLFPLDADVSLVCTVRPTGVSVTYNGEALYDWKGDFVKRLARYPNHPTEPLYLGGYGVSAFLFREITLEPLLDSEAKDG